jgi:hypothetical protein
VSKDNKQRNRFDPAFAQLIDGVQNVLPASSKNSPLATEPIKISQVGIRYLMALCQRSPVRLFAPVPHTVRFQRQNIEESRADGLYSELIIALMI